MLRAKSKLSHLSLKEIITIDYKNFETNSVQYGIGVLETVSPEELLDQSSQLQENLEKVAKLENVNFVLFVIVDVISSKSYCFMTSNQHSLLKNLDGKKEKEYWVTKDMVSRKLQILPFVQNALLKAQKC